MVNRCAWWYYFTFWFGERFHVTPFSWKWKGGHQLCQHFGPEWNISTAVPLIYQHFHCHIPLQLSADPGANNRVRNKSQDPRVLTGRRTDYWWPLYFWGVEWSTVRIWVTSESMTRKGRRWRRPALTQQHVMKFILFKGSLDSPGMGTWPLPFVCSRNQHSPL